MLLLVLILVLVAFGLLVVALLTGNVLSAWLSVAVSVAAAVVLVIDWLQRRSAVKAGRAGADSAVSSSPETPHADLDPVTEVLPVYTPDDDDEPVTTEKRFDRVRDGQQTVVMPAVQPSGSAARPSGAEGTSTPSGGFSSPRVTSGGPEVGPAEGSGTRPDDDDGRTDRADGRSDAEATVVVNIRKAGIGGSSADADAPGGAAPSSAGSDTDRSDEDAGLRADRGAAAEPHPRVGEDTPATDRRGDAPATDRQADAPATDRQADAPATDRPSDTPATDRQAEPAPTGSQASSTGAAVAGAAGLAGAAVAGGLAAAKDRPDDRTTADTQVVNTVNAVKSGDSGGPSAGVTPDEHRPAGAASSTGGDNARTGEAAAPDARSSEERRAGVGAPPTDHPAAASSPTVEGRFGSDRAAGQGTDAGAAPAVGAAGSRTDAEPAEHEHADSRADLGATGSRADADRAPAESAAAGRGADSGGGDPRSTWSSDKTTHDAPAAEGRPGAWAAESEPSGGERPGTTWSAEKPAQDAPAEGRPGDAPAAGGRSGDAPAAEGRAGAWAAGSESPAGERRGGDAWASGAATGDTRPANAWATGAAAASNAGTSAGATERRPSDARGAEPGDHPNGTSAGTASRPGADEGGRSASGAAAPDTSAAEPPTRDDQAARTTFGGSGSGSGHDLFEPSRGGGHQVPAQQAGSAYQEETEPPEESADPALGRVAATVEDEVLVIDEQPRYHLMGCRALMAQQTIPLPAREAVELGFTPCGWCNPVAALGARHPASARP